MLVCGAQGGHFNLLADSAGIKVLGAVEWHDRKHWIQSKPLILFSNGLPENRERRRKVNLVMDAALMMWAPSDGTGVQQWVLKNSQNRTGTSKSITIGIDLVKAVFQVHRADAPSSAVLLHNLNWDQVPPAISPPSRCVVAIEVSRSEFVGDKQLRQG